MKVTEIRCTVDLKLTRIVFERKYTYVVTMRGKNGNLNREIYSGKDWEKANLIFDKTHLELRAKRQELTK
jgi:hypothetical protein